MNVNVLSDNAIKALIGFIILVFFKGFFSLSRQLNLGNVIFKEKTMLKYISETIDTIMNTILVLLSIFVLFLRKENKSILVIILAIMFILKGFFQYFLDLKLYEYTNIHESVIDKMRQVKFVNSVITDLILALVSFCMIKIIFYS